MPAITHQQEVSSELLLRKLLNKLLAERVTQIAIVYGNPILPDSEAGVNESVWTVSWFTPQEAKPVHPLTKRKAVA